MNEKILKYKALIDLIKTTDDLVVLDEEIDMVLQSIYHTEIYDLEEILAKFVRVRIAVEIKKLISQDSISGKEQTRTLLSDAYRTICALPILKLTMAFEPSESIIDNISNWARSNLQSGILLDLSLDRSLLGGAQIVYEGKYYDYSLKKKIKEVFENNNFTI